MSLSDDRYVIIYISAMVPYTITRRLVHWHLIVTRVCPTLSVPNWRRYSIAVQSGMNSTLSFFRHHLLRFAPPAAKSDVKVWKVISCRGCHFCEVVVQECHKKHPIPSRRISEHRDPPSIRGVPWFRGLTGHLPRHSRAAKSFTGGAMLRPCGLGRGGVLHARTQRKAHDAAPPGRRAQHAGRNSCGLCVTLASSQIRFRHVAARAGALPTLHNALVALDSVTVMDFSIIKRESTADARKGRNAFSCHNFA